MLMRDTFALTTAMAQHTADTKTVMTFVYPAHRHGAATLHLPIRPSFPQSSSRNPRGTLRHNA